MYKCEIHGNKKVGWCEECGKIIHCDCSTTKTDNGYVSYAELSRTIEIFIDYCPVCFEVKQIR